jgi:PAS domain S-box-containing protein
MVGAALIRNHQPDEPIPKIDAETVGEERWHLAEIGRIVSSSTNLEDVFSAFAEQAGKLVTFDRLAISVIDPITQELYDAHIAGFQFDGSNLAGPYSLVDSSLPASVYEEHKVVALNEAQMSEIAGSAESEGASDNSARISAGLVSAMFTPVTLQGEIVGSLVFRSKKTAPYGDHEIELAAQIAAQISGVISFRRQLKLLESESLERQLLAHENDGIAEIGRIVGSTVSLNEVFSSLSNHIQELIGFDRFVIAEYSSDGQELSGLFTHGLDVVDSPLGTAISNEHSEIFEHNVERKEHLVLRGDDYANFVKGSPYEELRFTSGLRSLLAVPIIWQDNTIGSMFFRSLNPDAFSDHEIHLATQISQSIAGAIATTRQYSLIAKQSEEAHRIAEEQARIAEIGQIVSSTLDLKQILAAFAEQARRLVPFDRLVIAIADEDLTSTTAELVVGTDVDRGAPNESYPFSENPLQSHVILNQQTFVANGAEYRKEAEGNTAEQERLSTGLRSVLMVPLIWQGRCFGSMNMRSFDAEAYGRHETGLAEQIGAQIAGAIAASNRLKQLGQESQDRKILADQQAVISEIGRIVSSSLDIEEVLNAFVDQARLLVPFDRIVVTVANDDLSAVTDVLVDGIEIEGDTTGVSHPISESSLHGDVISNQVPFIANGDDYKKYAKTMPYEFKRYEAGMRALLLIPLVWQGQCFGSINFRSVERNAYGDLEIGLAEQIGAQIAGAIAASDRLKQLERESRDRKIIADQQAAIAEIGRLASSTRDIREVLPAFIEQAKSLLTFDRIVISLISDDRTELTDVLVDGNEVEAGTEGKSYPIESGSLPSKLIDSQSTIAMGGEEYTRLAEVYPAEKLRRDSGFRSIIMMPLIWQGRIFGSLNIRSRDPKPYTKRSIGIADQISAQIAGAIATSTQYKSIEEESAKRQKLAEEQTSIAEIGRIVSSSLDIEEVLSAFIEQVRYLVPFDRIVISTVNEKLTEITRVIVRGMGEENSMEGVTLPFPTSNVLHEAMTARAPFVATGENYVDYRNRSGEELDSNPLFNTLNSFLLIPLFWQGRAIGSLNLRSVDPQAYGDAEIALASQIGAQIAGAIATSAQFKFLEEESAKRLKLAEEQAIIAEIGRIVSSSLDLDVVLSEFVDQARLLVPFDRIAISIVNEELTEVTDVLVRGIGEAEAKIGTTVPFPTSSTILQDAIAGNVPFLTTGEDYIEYSKNVRLELRPEFDDLKSLMLIPLIWQGRPIGSLNFRSLDSFAYDDTNAELAKQIGAQIAGAIAASRQYQELETAVADVQMQSDALDAADDAIIIRNADASVAYVNSAWERQTGYTLDEVTGTNFLYPEQLGKSNEELENLWDDTRVGKSWHTRIVSQHRDGSEYTVDTTMSPVSDDSGEISYFVGVRRDVTEQVKSEDVNKALAAALEASADAVIILNAERGIEWVNDSYVTHTGYSKEESMAVSAPFLRSDKDSKEMFEDSWEQVLSGKTWTGRIWTKRKDGSEYLGESSLAPVYSDDGTIAKFVATRRDITEQVQAEQDRESRRELDAQNQQLLHLNEQREEFFSTVSHELRTPLTSVMAFADILSRDRDGTLTNLQLEHLDVIKRNGRNLNELVEDMLDFSRLSTDKLKLEKSEFEIHALIDSVVESLSPTAEQRKQTLAIEPSSTPIWVNADHSRIVQVVSNLITNSCKYSPPSSRVTVKAEISGDNLAIAVSDEGFGIPQKDLNEIFSPFFRSEQIEVREESGVGLGLAISKTLITLHGGALTVDSELGKGTVMTLTLPGATAAPSSRAKD